MQIEPAGHELSDPEIEARFGPLFDEFLSELREDPHALADIIESIASRQPSWRRKTELTPPAPTPEQPVDREARDRKIEALRRGGHTISDIAASVGLGTTTVDNILRKRGVRIGRTKSSRWADRDSQILEMHRKGRTGREIAKILNCSPATVSMRLKKIED